MFTFTRLLLALNIDNWIIPLKKPHLIIIIDRLYLFIYFLHEYENKEKMR